MIVPYISVLINIIACNCKLLCVWWLTKSIMLQSKHHQPTISFTVLFRLCKCDSTVYSRFISPKHNHNATQKMVCFSMFMAQEGYQGGGWSGPVVQPPTGFCSLLSLDVPCIFSGWCCPMTNIFGRIENVTVSCLRMCSYFGGQWWLN